MMRNNVGENVARTESPGPADGVDRQAQLDEDGVQLMITNGEMPCVDGIDLLRKISERPEPHSKGVVMSTQDADQRAIEALRVGTQEGELTLSGSLVFGSPAMDRLATLMQRIGPCDVTVLLYGESGTGKERVADALVAASKRADKPFLRFNCAALTAELAEAELFGHTRGAFTGAVKARPGLFREADGGTILLDEIGELPLSIQAKLLRVLQEGEVRPLGEDQPVKVDVRIIAATHRDLLEMSAQGMFRQDLYYRLNVVQLKVPPLRERAQDIPLLARHFLTEYSRRFSVGPFRMTPGVLNQLTQYSWPGNVRELENAIASAVVLSVGKELDLSLLPEMKNTPEPMSLSVQNTASSGAPSESLSCDLKERVGAYERDVIVAALKQTKGNRTHTARTLRIDRATLQGKLRKYGLASGDADLQDAAAPYVPSDLVRCGS
jgi:two-component system, NtrC family, response regulator HydG